MIVPPSPLASYGTFIASSLALTAAASRDSSPENKMLLGGSEMTPAT